MRDFMTSFGDDDALGAAENVDEFDEEEEVDDDR
jgi:hypothetical protein